MIGWGSKNPTLENAEAAIDRLHDVLLKRELGQFLAAASGASSPKPWQA